MWGEEEVRRKGGGGGGMPDTSEVRLPGVCESATSHCRPPRLQAASPEAGASVLVGHCAARSLPPHSAPQPVFWVTNEIDNAR